jgi:hypothetical protein
MLKTLLTSLALLTGFALCNQATAQPRIPPKYQASPLEITQLPKYCWAQYVDGAYSGHPIYSIPAVCGPYTNHFCPALVSLVQSTQLSRNKQQRNEAISHAAREVRYTLRYIKPDCPIYPDVTAAQMRAEAMEKLAK